MTDEDEETRYMGANVKEGLAERVMERLEHGEWSSIVKEVARTIAGGDGHPKVAAIEGMLHNRKQRLREARQKRREAEARIESLEEEIQDLQHQRERIETLDERYDAALEQLESSFRRGELGRLFPDHAAVRDLADDYEKVPIDVIDDLRERNPDVPNYAFQQRTPRSQERFEGLPEEQVHTPVEHRTPAGSPRSSESEST